MADFVRPLNDPGRMRSSLYTPGSTLESNACNDLRGHEIGRLVLGKAGEDVERPDQHVPEEAARCARHRCAFLEAPPQPGRNTHLAFCEWRAAVAAREKRVLLGLQQIPCGIGVEPQLGPSGNFDQNDVFPGDRGRADSPILQLRAVPLR